MRELDCPPGLLPRRCCQRVPRRARAPCVRDPVGLGSSGAGRSFLSLSQQQAAGLGRCPQAQPPPGLSLLGRDKKASVQSCWACGWTLCKVIDSHWCSAQMAPQLKVTSVTLGKPLCNRGHSDMPTQPRDL